MNTLSGHNLTIGSTLSDVGKAQEMADEIKGQSRAANISEISIPINPLTISLEKLPVEENVRDRKGKVNAVFGVDTQIDSGPQHALNQKLMWLSTACYSPQAQKELTQYLTQNYHFPEDTPELIAFAKSIWKNVSELNFHGQKIDVSILRDWFHRSGIKFEPGTKLSTDGVARQINLGELRQIIKSMCGSKGSPRALTQQDLRKIGAFLSHTYDATEVAWARKEIYKKIFGGYISVPGNSNIKNSPKAILERILRRGGNSVSKTEIKLALHTLRIKNFDEQILGHMQAVLSGCTDADLLFYAQDALKRELCKARKQLEKMPIQEQKKTVPLLERAQKVLQKSINKGTRGKCNARAIRKQAFLDFKNSKITLRELMVRQAAANASQTYGDYIHWIGYSEALYSLIFQMIESMNDIWHEMWKNFVQSMSGDTYDSFGNLIETVEERLEKELRKLRDVARIRLQADQIKHFAMRACLEARRSAVEAQLACTTQGTSLYDSLKSRWAGIESQIDDPAPSPVN